MGELDHYVTNHLSYEEAPVHQKQELHEQVFVDEHIATILNNRHQTETSTMRLHCASRTLKRFGVWVNSSNLKDCDFDAEYGMI